MSSDQPSASQVTHPKVGDIPSHHDARPSSAGSRKNMTVLR